MFNCVCKSEAKAAKLVPLCKIGSVCVETPNWQYNKLLMPGTIGSMLLVLGKLNASIAIPHPSGMINEWSRSIVKSVPEGMV